MVTQVTFGNFFNINGKNVLSGAGGSGLDTQSLINALVAAKSIQITQDQDQIKVNDNQSASLSQFQQLLSTFQSASDALRNPPGVGNDVNNAFKYTTGSVSSNTAVAGSSYVSVTAQPGAALQSYTISDITSLASAASQNTATFTLPSANDPSAVTAVATAGKFKAGTLTFAGGSTVTLSANDSLNTVAAKFNAVKSTTGISASVVQVDSTHFQLFFSATKTGTAANFDLTNNATVTDPSGVLNNIGIGTFATQNTGLFDIANPGTTVVSAGSLGITSQFAPGTITFAGGATITLNEGDSLTTVAQDFNSVSAQTGIAATVVNVSPGEYKLTFTATRPGASNNFDLTSVGTVTGGESFLSGAGLGVASAGTSTAAVGTNANFKINGIALQRQSNSVDDAITGVTLNLLQQTPDSGTHLTVAIQPDTTTVQNTIVNYVTAYNALRTFAAQQTQLNSDGTYAATAVLAGNQTFRTIMTDINQGVTSTVSGLSGLTSLAAVGITLANQPATSTAPEVDNILNVNDAQLASALTTNFQNVASLFGFTLTADSPDLQVFSATNALSTSSFTLNADPGTSTFTGTIGAGSPITFTAQQLLGANSWLLTGQAGTPFEGLQLIYGSNSTETVHVTATNGIAAQTYNTANASLTSNTGLMPLALKQLKDSDTSLNSDISQQNLLVAQYQQQLIQQFAALEKAVSSVNSLLASLNANANAALTASGH